jgi:hypothetical protein
MASLTKAINKDLFDKILPTFGCTRVQVPVWDEGQKMFLFDNYESASGNRYYRGIRFCDNIAIVENVGQYHSWTYIDSIELYAFNGHKAELVQKRNYEKTYYDEALIRSESEAMVRNYVEGVLKIQKSSMSQDQLEANAKSTVDGCYKSFLDKDFNVKLTQIIPQLEQ